MKEFGLPNSLRHLSDEEREEIRKYVQARILDEARSTSFLRELADWHLDQSIQWQRASEHGAANKPEPVRSSLLAKSKWHEAVANKLRSS